MLTTFLFLLGLIAVVVVCGQAGLINRSIPRNTNAATVAWMENFYAKVNADEAAYGLLAADSTAINAAVAPYVAAFELAGVTNREPNDPAGRTSPNVADMYAKRQTALEVCSAYAFMIHANPNVTDEDKIDAGVAPRNFTRTPILVPSTAPLLGITFATPGVHTLSYADSETPALKAKPFGAIGLQLYMSVGVEIAGTPEGAVIVGTFTTNPVAVAHETENAGKIATYFARWIGRRGDVGPWSSGVNMTVAF